MKRGNIFYFSTMSKCRKEGRKEGKKEGRKEGRKERRKEGKKAGNHSLYLKYTENNTKNWLHKQQSSNAKQKTEGKCSHPQVGKIRQEAVLPDGVVMVTQQKVEP